MKKKENEQGQITEKRELELHILIDKRLPGIREYARDCGINIHSVYEKVEDAQDSLLIKLNPYRLVVIDSGTGRFSATKVRKAIIDILNLCDENTKAYVFFTDTALKTDSKKELSEARKSVEWFHYKNTAQVIATLLQSDEKYIKVDTDIPDIAAEDLLNFKGNTVGKERV